MGRKSNTKGKEKRLARKEEQARIAASLIVVKKANELTDPLEQFPIFRKYNNSGIDCNLCIKKFGSLDDNTKMWAFDLTKRNMQHKYESCSWGWSDGKKLEELQDEAAWYLIAQRSDGKLLGFAHFRFDLDEGIEVLYCYELQLESHFHRKGLGKFMMQILELVAFKNNMKKVVLTILKNNSDSNFFKAINYQLDESSPMDDEDEDTPYEILSKVNKKLLPQSQQTNGNQLQPVSNNRANLMKAMHDHGGHAHGHCCPGHHHH
ncbi:N-alpha-acetyltransferase 40 [Atheta coriaria]|uniref:N-alpha-acetyltransferase 40 n=1 Tax=Dalotia coriaria TaxID=877792 RepID=UPI0031F36010